MTSILASRDISRRLSDEALRQSAPKYDITLFNIRRTYLNKNMTKIILVNGTKYSVLAGLFSAIQLTLSYKREKYEFWQSLIAGASSGVVCGTLLGGIKGARYGLFLGTSLSIPYAMIEYGMRMFVNDEYLLPYKPIGYDKKEESLEEYVREQQFQEQWLNKKDNDTH